MDKKWQLYRQQLGFCHNYTDFLQLNFSAWSQSSSEPFLFFPIKARQFVAKSISSCKTRLADI
jgi:hypothetical protein